MCVFKISAERNWNPTSWEGICHKWLFHTWSDRKYRMYLWLVKRLKFPIQWVKTLKTSLQLVAVAAERGIPLITANATSTYTQKIYANDGFDVVEEVIYQDFLVGRKWARIQKSCLIWSKFIPSTLIYLKALNQGNIICWKVDGEAVFHVKDSPHKSVQLVAKKSS